MSIEQVLSTDDSHSENINVPQWGCSVTVWSITARERAEIEKAWSNKKASSDPAGFRRDLLSKALRITSENAEKLLDKNAVAVETLFEAACRVGGFTSKDVEELEGN